VRRNEGGGVGGFVDDSPCPQLIQSLKPLVRCDIWLCLLTGTHGLNKIKDIIIINMWKCVRTKF